MEPSMRDLDLAVEQSHTALHEIINGSSQRYVELFSTADDVTLGNPFGPYVRGRRKVIETLEDAAARYRAGQVVGFDLVARHVTRDLACVVELERFTAELAGSEDLATISLRVTSVFRPEAGTWKLVHRHADPISSPRPTDSILSG